MTQIRLNHFLAMAGVASRRAADTLIEKGYVKVNQKVSKKLGVTVDPAKDTVEVLGAQKQEWTLVEPIQEKITYIMYKPRGYVTTLKGQRNEQTIAQFLPKGARVFPIGRLDKDSEGLLLLTNDGELSLRLTHPSSHIPKTYEVWCRMPKEYTENSLKSHLGRLEKGVRLGGKKTLPIDIKVIDILRNSVRLEIELKEGKNRQIRRILGRIRLEVSKLIRTGIGDLHLKNVNIKEGEARELSEEELGLL